MIPPPSGTEVEPKSSLANQFFSYSDSTNSLLTIAVDTLSQRNEENSFINSFVEDRGFPVWDNASAFYQQSLPIMLVPVVKYAQKTVSGIIFLTINNTQPVYRWIPRESDPAGFGKGEFENLMLIFEHQLFGEVQTPGVNVKSSRSSMPIKNKSLSGGHILISWETCGTVDVGDDGSSGEVQCHTHYQWVTAIDDGGGAGSGGFDGGFGGNGGEIPDGGSTGSTPAEQMASLLENDEFALLEVPCEEVPSWMNLAQYKTPQSVIDKLKNEYAGYINIQSLEDAAGAIINMDYFSVNVSDLPPGITPSDLMEEIRMSDMNDFINTDYAEFSPYNSHERTNWRSSDPLGAILSIDISLPADDGSVIVSDFNSGGWIFSTLHDPWNHSHPVSGNRKFGFTQNQDGSYTFYTRGVDRITNTIDAAVAEYYLDDPFADPDALWSSFQDKLKKYINQNGGNASVMPEDSTTYRPDWEDVSNIITGNGNIADLGCN